MAVTVKPLRLRLGRIEEELIDVQRHFSSINAALIMRRDDFTDDVRQNMLAAYEYLDLLQIEKRSQAFSGGNRVT